MARGCRYVLTLNKLIGIILTSVGIGMAIGLMLPWWGYLVIIGVVLIGIILICSN